MLNSGGSENHVAGLESPPRSSVEENATSSRDDVKFVARVWLLRITSARRVHLDLKAAMLEQRHRSHAVYRFQPSQRAGYADVSLFAARSVRRSVHKSFFV